MCDPIILSEWRRLLHIGLCHLEDDIRVPSDPFLALKHAEMVSDDIAYLLAPRRERRPGFGGHRVISRELNLLRTARQLVKMVLLRSAELWQCQQRYSRWHFTLSRLPNQLRKSQLPCPPLLNRPETYTCSRATQEQTRAPTTNTPNG